MSYYALGARCRVWFVLNFEYISIIVYKLLEQIYSRLPWSYISCKFAFSQVITFIRTMNIYYCLRLSESRSQGSDITFNPSSIYISFVVLDREVCEHNILQIIFFFYAFTSYQVLNITAEAENDKGMTASKEIR